MKSSLRRYSFDGLPRHTSTSTRDRRPILGSRGTAEIVIDQIYRARAERLGALLAFCVMPDHLHLVLALPGDATAARFMHRVKRGSSVLIGHALGTHGGVWEPRYFDRPITTEAQLHAAIQYVEGNPVRGGLVEDAERFEYSSAHPRWETDAVAFLGGTLEWLHDPAASDRLA